MRDLEKVISLMKQTDFLGGQIKSIEKLRERTENNEVIISVIGQFKRGKSSLINALTGEDVLPTGIIPLTTVVTEIRYAEKFRAAVCFEDGSEKKIEKEDMDLYCSEQKNRGNHKKVQSVKVYTPNHPFGCGTVLVDTPGVGSVHQHNTDSSYAYLEHSDAIIFLLSVDSPVSETERDFLVQAKEYAVKFFFAVNKTDNISKGDLSEFLDFCNGVITECMGTEVKIRPVSAKTGEGICDLKEELKTVLEKSHRALLEKSVYKKEEIIIGQALAKLNLAIEANRIPEEELKEKLFRIEEKQKELEGFSEEVSVLAEHRTEVLVDRIGKGFDEKTGEIRERVGRSCRNIFEENCGLANSEFKRRFRSEAEKCLKDELVRLNENGLAELEEGYAEIVGMLNKKAESVATFISDMLKEEFGLDYPVNESSFQVSARNDYLYHIGEKTTFMLDMSELSRFMPRKAANEKFYRNSTLQITEDVERNKTNMLYNYRYKMQESLRVLCGELSESVNGMRKEITVLLEHITEGLYDADSERTEKENKLKSIIAGLG